MTASIRSSAVNVDSSSKNQHFVAKPSGAQSGDTIYLFITSDASGDEQSTDDTGFTEVHSSFLNVDVDGDATGSAWYKAYADDDADPYQINTLRTERCAMLAMAVQDDGGIDTQTTPGVGTGTTVTVPSITTGEDNCLVVVVVWTNKATTPHSEISGYSLVNQAGVFSGGSISVQYKAVTTAGTESGNTITISAAEEWACGVFSIAPSAGTTFAEAIELVLSAALTVAGDTTQFPAERTSFVGKENRTSFVGRE